MKKLYLTLILILFFATAAFAKVNINTATVDELTTRSICLGPSSHAHDGKIGRMKMQPTAM